MIGTGSNRTSSRRPLAGSRGSPAAALRISEARPSIRSGASTRGILRRQPDFRAAGADTGEHPGTGQVLQRCESGNRDKWMAEVWVGHQRPEPDPAP